MRVGENFGPPNLGSAELPGKIMTREYLNYLQSDHWKSLRLAAIACWGDRCSNCSVPKVDIHHLRYGTLYDVSTSDLMPLCRRCHDEVHNSPRLKSLLLSNESSEKKRSLVLGFLAGRDEAITVKVKFQTRAQMAEELRSLQMQQNDRNKQAEKYEAQNRFYRSPTGRTIILTKKLIRACKTPRGGFSAVTVRALGLSWPLQAKWMRKLNGKRISEADYNLAYEGRFQTTKEIRESQQGRF
jgi:hypothetical protein